MPKHLTAEELEKFEQQKKNLREIRRKFPLQNFDYVPADFMTPEDVRIETMDRYLNWMEKAQNYEITKKEAEEYISKKIDEFPDYADTPILDSGGHPLHPLHFDDFLSSEILRDKLVEKAKTLPQSFDQYTNTSHEKNFFLEADEDDQNQQKIFRERFIELRTSSQKICELLLKDDSADAHNNKQSIQELIKKGFNRDAYNLAEIAAKEGFYDLIEPLRNSEQIYRNDSALHIAAQFGSKDLLQQLLDSGYDINSVNKEGKTAVDVVGEDNENGKFLNGFRCKKENEFATYSPETFDSIENKGKVNSTRSENPGGHVSDAESTFDDEESVTESTKRIKTEIPDTNEIAESLATTGTFFDDSKSSEALAVEKIRELLSERESAKDLKPNDAKNLYKKVSDEVVIDLKTQALAEAANIYRDEVVSNKLARALRKLEGIKETTSEGLFGKMWTDLLTKVDRQILHDFYQSQNPSTDFVESDDVFDSSKLKADPDLWENDSKFLTKMMKWCVKEADLRKDITAEIIKKSEERNEDLYGKNGEKGKIDQAVKAFKEPGKSPSNPEGEPIFSALQVRLLKSQ